MARDMYRQGDLLFIAIPKLPEDLTECTCLLEGQVLEDTQGALFLEVMRNYADHSPGAPGY